MLDARYRRYVQSLLLVFPMTGIVTAVNTLVAKGPAGLLTVSILERWAISCIVAFPCVLVLAPIAVKLTDRLVRPTGRG